MNITHDNQDDRFGYGLREQADIKEDLEIAKQLLIKAKSIIPSHFGEEVRLKQDIIKFLKKK